MSSLRLAANMQQNKEESCRIQDEHEQWFSCRPFGNPFRCEQALQARHTRILEGDSKAERHTLFGDKLDLSKQIALPRMRSLDFPPFTKLDGSLF